jgi:hypothetical protein
MHLAVLASTQLAKVVSEQASGNARQADFALFSMHYVLYNKQISLVIAGAVPVIDPQVAAAIVWHVAGDAPAFQKHLTPPVVNKQLA